MRSGFRRHWIKFGLSFRSKKKTLTPLRRRRWEERKKTKRLMPPSVVSNPLRRTGQQRGEHESNLSKGGIAGCVGRRRQCQNSSRCTRVEKKTTKKLVLGGEMGPT